jgi:hypothetical protein
VAQRIYFPKRVLVSQPGIELQGEIHVLRRNPDGDYSTGAPSPDGKHIVVVGTEHHRNSWMMEQFLRPLIAAALATIILKGLAELSVDLAGPLSVRCSDTLSNSNRFLV